MRISVCSSDVCSSDLFDVPEVAAGNCCRFGTVAFRLVGERKERADLLDREAKPPAMSDESKAAHIRSAVGAPSRGGAQGDRKSTRLNSSHSCASRMPSSA